MNSGRQSSEDQPTGFEKYDEFGAPASNPAQRQSLEYYDDFGSPVVEGSSEIADTTPGYVRYLIPIGRSGWAIAAGYLGLLSVLVVPAPLALITGIIAVRHLRRNPKLSGYPRAIFGIVAGGAVLVYLTFDL